MPRRNMAAAFHFFAEAANILAEALSADCVQVIGRKFVLFKQKPKESAYTAILAK